MLIKNSKRKKSTADKISFALTASVVILGIAASIFLLPKMIDNRRTVFSQSSEKHANKARGEKTFNATRATLTNGMQVVIIPNHRAPVVTHMVWYKAGAADEPAGKSGIAHFLEHLMF